MKKLNLPKGYTWFAGTGTNNGVGPGPVWSTPLPSGLAVEVWPNLEGSKVYTAQVVKPVTGYKPGFLYPLVDETFDTPYLLFNSGAELGGWLAAF
jgi:hypothetical protein